MIFLWFNWDNKITGNNFGAGNLIQNYAQWPDSRNPGKYEGFTCNVEYNNINGNNADSAQIINYANSSSLRTLDGGGLAWNVMGTKADAEWFELIDNDQDEIYKSTYTYFVESSQGCAGQAIEYWTRNGVAPLEEA